MPTPPSRRLRVGLLLYPGCVASGLLATADLLAATNLRAGARRFDVQWVGLQEGDVVTAHELRMRASQGVASAACDVVVVPGFWAHSVTQIDTVLQGERSLLRAIRGLPPSTQCWAYCSGVALLAEAGRLRGRSATATWWAASWLTARHADIDWQWQHSVVADRHVVTASGTHGYQSIIGQHVTRWLGGCLWHDVERFAVLPRPQSTLAVFQRLEAIDSVDPLMARLQALVEGLPANQLRLDTIAEALATSSRTLARRVSSAAGHSVGEHVRLLKLRQAGERLLHSGQTVAQISDALGFSNESVFRRSFKQATGLTPGDFVKSCGTGPTVRV